MQVDFDVSLSTVCEFYVDYAGTSCINTADYSVRCHGCNKDYTALMCKYCWDIVHTATGWICIECNQWIPMSAWVYGKTAL